MEINLVSLTKELAAVLSNTKDVPPSLLKKINKAMGTTNPHIINAMAFVWEAFELSHKEKLQEAAKLKTLIYDLRSLKYNLV